MYDFYHKYHPGDTVWIKHDNKITECVVCKATFEVDPSPSGTTEEKTYHLDMANDTTATIVLLPEDEVYESASDAIAENPPTYIPSFVPYDFTVDDIVWTYENYIDLEADVKQITINLDTEKVITPDNFIMMKGFSVDYAHNPPYWTHFRGGPTLEYSSDYSIDGTFDGCKVSDQTQTTNPYMSFTADQYQVGAGTFSTSFAFRIWIKKQDDYNTTEAGNPAPEQYLQSVAYIDLAYGTSHGYVATFIYFDTVTGEIINVADNNYATTLHNVSMHDGALYGHPDWWIIVTDTTSDASGGYFYTYLTKIQANIEDFLILGNFEVWMDVDATSLMKCYPHPVYEPGLPVGAELPCGADRTQTTEVLYHLLPTNGEYSTLIKDSGIVYATQQEALDAIAALITPTPTISITATVTPTATPANTPTATPDVTPTQTVTPNPTITPTVTPTLTVTPSLISTIEVLNSSGTSFDVPLDVINSSGSEFTVPFTVENSDGTSFGVG